MPGGETQSLANPRKITRRDLSSLGDVIMTRLVAWQLLRLKRRTEPIFYRIRNLVLTQILQTLRSAVRLPWRPTAARERSAGDCANVSVSSSDRTRK